MNDPHIAQLRWRCRRGMRELDKLTEGYLLNSYATASADHQRAFRDLLELPDPELLSLLYAKQDATDLATEQVLAAMRELLQHPRK